MKINVKRIYELPSPEDGRRILVDRLWPRGLSKADAKIDYWAKDISPSNDLRKWYQHDPAKWDEFRRRYFADLNATPDAVQSLLDNMPSGTVTFLYSSKEKQLNNAVALRDYVQTRIG
jgi:uncharacterized protein YeaO (DUF488 family)